MPIHIFHIVETMLGMGGMEKNVVNVIRRMDPERFAHTVCVVRKLGNLSDALPERVNVLCLGKINPVFSFLTWDLARGIEAAKPDIVHSRNWGTVEAVVAGGWTGSCALVHSEHGIDSVNGQCEPRRRRWFRRLAFELADRVFAVSYQLRDFHARNTGFPAGKMGVIHNGVDTGEFRPQPAARICVRQRLGIAPDTFCIGAIGRLEPVKDLFTLLRATAELPDSGGRWRLLIAGDGSELCTLRQFVDGSPNLRGRVEFVGDIRYIPEFLNALDVYALPSVAEGISNSLLEAMATGLPVIASATGGNPEVVVDGESGLLFPVGDSGELAKRLQMVREQVEPRVSLGKQALQRVKRHFSMDSMVQEYERLYSGVVPRRNGSRAAFQKPVGECVVEGGGLGRG